MSTSKAGGLLPANTQTVAIDAPPDQVFDFVANPETLPQWAVGFCREISRSGDGWIVRTALGDIPIRYETNRQARTVDFYFSHSPGAEVAAFSRIVVNGGGSEFVFTQLQSPGMPDEVFERQIRALGEELQVLRSVIHARAVCPA